MAKANNKTTRKEAKKEKGIKISVKEDISRRAKLRLIMGPIIILIFAALFFAFIHKPYVGIKGNNQEDIKAKVISDFSDDVKKNTDYLAKSIKFKKS
jgi:hypothetical protein